MSEAAQIRTRLLVKDWKLELQRAFDGQRAATIDRLGGLDEHLRVKIANSADASESRVELQDALDEMLVNWRWQPETELEATGMMLDVIRAFQPARGGVKTLELVRAWPARAPLLEVYPGRTIDVRNLALRVLEKYYAAPQDNSREWNRYTDVLFELLGDENLGAYALMRLRALDAPALHKRTKAVLESDSRILKQLVGRLLRVDDRGAAADALRLLYTVCLPDLLREFKRAVEVTGARVQQAIEEPVIDTALDKIEIVPDDGQIIESMNPSKAELDEALTNVVLFPSVRPVEDPGSDQNEGG
jgi:hypothetical protein